MDIETCLNFLRAGNAEEKLAAVEQLRSLSFGEIAENLVESIEKEASAAEKEKRMQVLANFAFPQVNVTLVEKMYLSSDPFVRNAVVDLLRKNDEAFLAAMATLSCNPDKDVRKFVVDTLAGHASGEGLRIVKARLEDDNINVRQSAVEALGAMGETAAAPDIEAILERETNLMVRCTCLEALAKLGHSPASRDIIAKLAQEANALLRFSFLHYLGALGRPEDLNLLEGWLDNANPRGLPPLVSAMTGIAERHPHVTFSTDLVQKLRHILRAQGDSDLAWELARLLLLGLGDEALAQAREMSGSDSPALRIAAQEFLDQADAEDSTLMQRQG